MLEITGLGHRRSGQRVRGCVQCAIPERVIHASVRAVDIESAAATTENKRATASSRSSSWAPESKSATPGPAASRAATAGSAEDLPGARSLSTSESWLPLGVAHPLLHFVNGHGHGYARVVAGICDRLSRRVWRDARYRHSRRNDLVSGVVPSRVAVGQSLQNRQTLKTAILASHSSPWLRSGCRMSARSQDQHEVGARPRIHCRDLPCHRCKPRHFGADRIVSCAGNLEGIIAAHVCPGHQVLPGGRIGRTDGCARDGGAAGTHHACDGKAGRWNGFLRPHPSAYREQHNHTLQCRQDSQLCAAN